MKSKDYWQERAEQVLLEAERNTNEYLNQLNVTYTNAIESINRDIEKIFTTYKKDFSLDEAKAWLNEEISSTQYNNLKNILPTITDERCRKQLLMRLNAPAYRYRITRLEHIKQTILSKLAQATDAELQSSKQCYVDTLLNSYQRTMFDLQQGVGMAFDFAQLPEQTINKLLSTKSYGRNFSSRIWSNCDAVAKNASEVIKNGVLTGQSIQRMSKSFMEKTYTDSMHNATRLIRTEVNYFSNQGALQSYKEAELDKYEFCATLDLRTSVSCQDHDGQIHLLDEAIVGKNYPPMHPYCRSCAIPIIDMTGLQSMNKRRARDPVTGKGIVVDKMTYKEWQSSLTTDKAKDIMKPSKDDGVKDVHTLGKLDIKKYQCVTKDIVTDEAVITENQIQHIKDRHPNDYERYSGYIPKIIQNPDYILGANKPDTAFILKRFAEGNEQFQLILRLKTSNDPVDYKNSVITFLKLDEKRYKRYLRTKMILYKKE